MLSDRLYKRIPPTKTKVLAQVIFGLGEMQGVGLTAEAASEVINRVEGARKKQMGYGLLFPMKLLHAKQQH